MHCGCWAPSGTPVSLRFVPHAHGALRFGRCLLSSHVLLRSRFAHALRSLVSQRKRRAAAHNRVVLGSENLPSRSTVNQALGDAVATGGFGQASHCPLCRAFADPSVGLDLRPTNDPRCLRNTILSASTRACSAELCITIRLYLDRTMGLSKISGQNKT